MSSDMSEILEDGASRRAAGFVGAQLGDAARIICLRAAEHAGAQAPCYNCTGKVHASLLCGTQPQWALIAASWPCVFVTRPHDTRKLQVRSARRISLRTPGGSRRAG